MGVYISTYDHTTLLYYNCRHYKASNTHHITSKNSKNLLILIIHSSCSNNNNKKCLTSLLIQIECSYTSVYNLDKCWFIVQYVASILL